MIILKLFKLSIYRIQPQQLVKSQNQAKEDEDEPMEKRIKLEQMEDNGGMNSTHNTPPLNSAGSMGNSSVEMNNIPVIGQPYNVSAYNPIQSSSY